MLRITPIESGNHHVVLRLEGKVSGPWVSELSEACEKVLNDGNALVLNLAEVSFLDSSGVGLLTKFHTRGIQLEDCSMFVKEQLKAAGFGSLEIERAVKPLLSE